MIFHQISTVIHSHIDLKTRKTPLHFFLWSLYRIWSRFVTFHATRIKWILKIYQQYFWLQQNIGRGKQNDLKRKIKQKFDLLFFVLFRGTSHLRPFRLSTKNTIYCLGVHATVDGRFTSFSSFSVSLFSLLPVLGLFMASFVLYDIRFRIIFDFLFRIN